MTRLSLGTRLSLALLFGLLTASPAPAAEPRATPLPQLVVHPSSSPLLTIKVVVHAGSAMDPRGREGLAGLTAKLLIDGSFGPADRRLTKEELARVTRPWGTGAYPSVDLDKETTTFTLQVPLEKLEPYLAQVFGPMFTQPQFAAAELERLRGENLAALRAMALEQIELMGLFALDQSIHAGTSYAHPAVGTESGLAQITVNDVRRFYEQHYRLDQLVVGLSSHDEAVAAQVRSALQPMARPGAASPTSPPPPPPAFTGRHVEIIALPNAISTGLHAGFPLDITRSDPDYWPLYLANIWFGTHRDGFGLLYQTFREARGYNYGDYSYIEHFAGRPSYLFPPTNTPRRHQYFSIWIRPVQHEYAVHVLKALTWELDNVIRQGLTEAQVEATKTKARVLYLSLAADADRILGYRLDDAFYGLEPGYLESYLERIDAVTCDQVNAALRRHLQTANLKYVVVTDDDVAPSLADAIAADGVAWGKSPVDYQIEVQESAGQKTFVVPEAKLDLLRKDAVWAHARLGIPREQIRQFKAEERFRQ